MGNCLKTQLKEVVNNDSLFKLGTLKFRVVSTSGDFTEKYSFIEIGAINNQQEFTVRALGGAKFVTTSFADINDSSKWQTETESHYINSTTRGIGLWLCNNDGYIEIENKYNIKLVQSKDALMEGNCVIIDIDQMKYSTVQEGFRGIIRGNVQSIKNCNYIKNYSTDLYGDINCFANNSSITYLSCSSNKSLTGNIESLGKSTNIVLINFSHTSVEGTIENFVKEQIANGRTSASNIDVSFADTGVTFNSHSITDGYLSWTSNGSTANITFNEESITISL